MISKIKNFNFQAFLKSIFLGFIKASIKTTLAFYILETISGYRIFVPFVVRKVVDPSLLYLAENSEKLLATESGMTDYTIFLIAAPKEALGIFGTAGSAIGGAVDRLFNLTPDVGYSNKEVILYGLGFMGLYYSLGLAQKYVIPPLMRSMGFSNYFADHERLANIEQMLHEDRAHNHEIFLQLSRIDRCQSTIIRLMEDHRIIITERMQEHSVRDNQVLVQSLHMLYQRNEQYAQFVSNSFAHLRQQITTLADRPNPTEEINNLVNVVLERVNAAYRETRQEDNQHIERTLSNLQAQLMEAFDVDNFHNATSRLNNVEAIFGNFLEEIRQHNNETGARVERVINAEMSALRESTEIIPFSSNSSSANIPIGNPPELPAGPPIDPQRLLASVAAASQLPEPRVAERTVPVQMEESPRFAENVSSSLNSNVSLNDAIRTMGNSGTFTICPGRSNGSFDLTLTLNGTQVPAPSGSGFISETISSALTATTSRLGRSVGYGLSNHIWNIASTRLVDAGLRGIAGAATEGSFGAIRGVAQGLLNTGGNSNPYGPFALVRREKPFLERMAETIKDWGHHE